MSTQTVCSAEYFPTLSNLAPVLHIYCNDLGRHEGWRWEVGAEHSGNRGEIEGLDGGYRCGGIRVKDYLQVRNLHWKDVSNPRDGSGLWD